MGQLTKQIVLLILIFIPPAFLFGIYDLDISKQIVNENSVWARFLEEYGMIPGIFVILSGIYIYYSYIMQKSDLWSYIQKAIFFLVSSGLIFYLYEILLGEIVKYYFLLFLIVSFIDGIIVLMYIHKIKQVSNPILIKYAKVVVGMALFGYVIGIQAIKFLWGRVRFRELDASFSQFTPWYLPQGITGFDSFPSGHAAMGWMLLALLILFNKSKAWIKNFIMMLIIMWAVLLAYSRVVIGAHFASDVLFGSFFIILTYLILRGNFNQQVSNNK
jgi:membrane-associated phospholipid phosphatase